MARIFKNSERLEGAMKSSEPDIGVYPIPENSKLVKHYDASTARGKGFNQANLERK
jgi:hypothetical protein